MIEYVESLIYAGRLPKTAPLLSVIQRADRVLGVSLTMHRELAVRGEKPPNGFHGACPFWIPADLAISVSDALLP